MLDLQLNTEDAPILRLLDSIIAQGVQENASDIHLEPGTEKSRIRYRIDGVLQQMQSLSGARHNALVSCVKLMAGMDIAEKRLPQDGRSQVIVEGRRIDLRVSSLPTILGEKLVIRILDGEAQKLSLAELNFTSENLELYRAMYRASHGLILLTGPTGSGKTTTLYATLMELNSPARNIITVEDPVEYRIDGLNQVAVNARTGLTFARGLRSILRQDPNIIMVGEIRDRETAEISIQAALTGHLVFSTLHTNTAAGTITRLLDMGVEPFLLASALRGVVSQRLVRTLCSRCKGAYYADVTGWEYKYFGLSACERQQFFCENGCAACHGSGFKGRVAVQEVFPVGEPVKEKILQGATETELLQVVKTAFPTFHTLQEDGCRKVLEGKTSPREVLRVIGAAS